jgi:hypothetical protein
MNFLTILPLAFVMIAGPQILSAIFLATSEDWRRNSAAFVIGAAISISICVLVAFGLGIGASNSGASSDAIYIVVMLLLVAAGVHVFLTRKTSEPPSWMGKLQTATPRFSFRLGFLLLGIFPTDILTSFAVGSALSNDGEPWWHYLPFLALTLLFLALPSLALLVAGQRAADFLPKARDWMNANSWVINEIVIVFFVVLTAGNL